jgi:hypothetical protein
MTPERDERSAAYQPLDWRSVKTEATRIKVSPRALLRACASGECRSVRVNARGDVRLLPGWTDAWMLSRSTPISKKGRPDISVVTSTTEAA